MKNYPKHCIIKLLKTTIKNTQRTKKRGGRQSQDLEREKYKRVVKRTAKNEKEERLQKNRKQEKETYLTIKN